MPKQVMQYDLLISCPGDITDAELSAINEVVSDVNRAYEDVMGIKIRTRHWSKDSYAESGGNPQDLLNKQFVKDCDLTIALFWTRFGTPTDKWGSGTEEEIEIMLGNNKQVFVGFSDIPIPPKMLSDTANIKEYQRIQDFRTSYQKRGLYFTYASVEDLKKVFYAHLSKHFIIRNEQDRSKVELSPKLSVQSISDSGLHNGVYVYNFGEFTFLNDPLERVHELFKKIQEYEVYDYVPMKLHGILGAMSEANEMFYSKVSFDNGKKKLITDCAKALKVELGDNFFSVGDLRKHSLGINPMSGPRLEGSNDEQNKYYDLNDLHNAIEYVIAFSQFKESYSNLQFIRLAVANNGMTYDEDIEVSLSFPKNTLTKHRALPVIDSYPLGKIKQKHNLEDFFGIEKTSKYTDYDSTVKPSPVVNNYRPYTPLFTQSDPVEDFYKELDNIFIYDYYEEGDEMILKFHIDYLKHNTIAAFPSIIFVRDNNFEINFVLKSKHYKDEVQGKIENI